MFDILKNTLILLNLVEQEHFTTLFIEKFSMVMFFNLFLQN